jgi:hypothetical protein
MGHSLLAQCRSRINCSSTVPAPLHLDEFSVVGALLYGALKRGFTTAYRSSQ